MLRNKFSEASRIGDPSFDYPHDIVRRAGYLRGQTIAHSASRCAAYLRKLTRSLRDSLRRDTVYDEFKGLGDHMLQDIGMTRGDLHRAFYADSAPANTNARSADARNVA